MSSPLSVIRLGLVSGLVGMILIGASRADSNSGAPTVLIQGNGVSITKSYFRTELGLFSKSQRDYILSSNEHVNEFVQRLFRERRMERQAEQDGLQHTSKVAAQIAQARRQILISALLKHYRQHQKMPDFLSLAHDYYLAHKGDFTHQEAVRVAQILFRTDHGEDSHTKEKEAEKVLGMLKSGGGFRAIGKKIFRWING